MNLKIISSVDLKGKKVLLRTDFNVPVKDGAVSDDTRIRESLPTIKLLIAAGARIAIVSHLGRPKGGVNPEFSLKPVAQKLSELLEQPVMTLDDCVGESVKSTVSVLPEGGIVLLENVRFHPEEEANDPEFAKKLADGFDIYVSDAFGTVHRAHASTAGVSAFLPSYAGLLVEKEVRVLSSLIENPVHPVCLIVGGAKVDTKIGILEKFLTLADSFLIGGALANTFLAAQGVKIGTSLFEPEKVPVAKKFLEAAKAAGKTVLLPVDAVIAAEVAAGTPVSAVTISEVPDNMKILDIGLESRKLFAAEIAKSKTIIWNGPMGLNEIPEFAEGTRAVGVAVSEATASATKTSGAASVLGGGDTIDAIHALNLDEKSFTHISTGGGAMLEFLEGKDLPGVKVLMI
ncbi:MAG: phosphoglycerate kinase [Candidatus Gracilibacteria bacterium]|jgi:phosphoglycerate kinase